MTTTAKSTLPLAWGATGAAVAYGLACHLLGLAQGQAALRGVGTMAALLVLVGVITGIHAALRRGAEEERLEDEALQGREAAALFAGDATTRGVRARNLAQFEKYAAPGLTLLLGLAELVLAWWLWRQSGTPSSSTAGLGAVATVAVGGLAFFLAGSYLCGLAFGGGQPTLRAVAAECVALATVAGLLTAALLAGRLGLAWVPPAATRLLAALLVVRALERGFTVVLLIYRPRTAAAERLPYESRLSVMVAQPRGLVRGLAESLNYQFGIRLSEAGLWRVLLTWVPLALLFQVVVLAVFSCVVIINPGEAGWRERFGRPYPTAAAAELGPGWHLLLPWPIDQVYRYPVHQVQQLRFTSATPPPPDTPTPLGRWWIDDTTRPLDFLVAVNRTTAPTGAGADTGNPTAAYNLLAVGAVCQFRVRDLAAWVTCSQDGAALLETLARRELVRLCARHDLLASLNPGPRESAAEQAQRRAAFAASVAAVHGELRTSLQAAADRLGLGVAVLHFGLEWVQPPALTAPDFQALAGAGDDRQRLVLEARREAAQTGAAARARDFQWRSEARAYRVSRQLLADAERDSFARLNALAATEREIFRVRTYLDALEAALQSQSKIVLATDAAERTLTLDLKPRLGDELFKLTPSK